MRYLAFFFSLALMFNSSAIATWNKINDVDYIWGPFKIYNISLFTETGDYTDNIRPLMLTLKYAKPVDGRDFAISLARSWGNLGIVLQNQDEVVDRLRKILPNIKKDDLLSYIALEDKGYFVLNDLVIPEEFNKEFNDAIVAVWLDPKVEIGKKLITRNEKEFIANTPQTDAVQTLNGAPVTDTALPTESDKNTQSNAILEQKPTDVQMEAQGIQKTEKKELPNDTEKTLEKTEKVPLNEKMTEPPVPVQQEPTKPKNEDAEIEISPPLDPIPEKGKQVI